MSPVADTVLGSVALASGALVLARRKGDRLHRLSGRVYAGVMVALCGLAFGLRDSTPFFEGVGPFHVAALVSLATVAVGVAAARRRRPDWLAWHLQGMAWSYVGVVMATGGHLQAPLAGALADLGLGRGAAIGLSLAAVWGLPPLVGEVWIARRLPGWLALGRDRAPSALAEAA